MADSINVKIGVDGEAQFRASINNIIQQSKELAAEMKAVTSGMAAEDKQMDVLGRQMETQRKLIDALTTKYDEQKKAVDQTRAALEKAKAEFGENSTQAQKLQTELLRQETQLSKTKTQINNAEAAYNSMATQVDKLGDELNESGNAAEKSESKFKGLGSVLKTVGAAMGAVFVAAGAAAVKLGTEVVAAYADYEQLVGGIDTLFKDSSLELQKYASNAYKTAGLSANDYMETVTSFSASLISSLGGDTEKAVKYADMAITDMSDNANKMGSDMASIQAAYQGFAKQNYTMLDNLKLGYGGTKTEMERLLADAEAISGIHYDISSYADVVEAIHVIQTSMDITGTTAKEAEHTISGSINAMQAALQNLLVGFGNADADITQLCNNLVDSFTDVVENITPVIENIIAALPTVLEALLNAAVALMPTMLSTVISIINKIAATLIAQLPTIIKSAIEIVLAIVQGIIQTIPELIPAVVDAVIQICTTLIDNIDLIIEAAIELVLALAEGLVAAIPKLIEAVPKLITSLVAKLTDPQMMLRIAQAALQLIVGLGKGLVQAIPTLLSSVGQIGSAIWSGLKNAFASIWQIGSNIVSGIWSGISSSLQWIKDKITGWVGNVLSFIKGIFGIKSPSKVMRDQVGVYLAEGIGVGFTDEMKTVRKEMANAIPMNFDTAINANLNAGASASDAVISGRSSGGTSQAFTINVYGAEGQNVDDLANAVSLKIQQKFVRKEAVWA